MTKNCGLYTVKKGKLTPKMGVQILFVPYMSPVSLEFNVSTQIGETGIGLSLEFSVSFVGKKLIASRPSPPR